MSESSDNKQSGSRSEVHTLIAALAHENPVSRQSARESLVAIGKPAVDLLIQLLGDAKPHARWEAAKALTAIRDPASASALIMALEDKDSDVRWLAAQALIVLRRHALEPLLTALSDRSDSPWLREGAHHVLHDLHKRQALVLVKPVLAALDEPEPEITVPAAAYTALNELKSS